MLGEPTRIDRATLAALRSFRGRLTARYGDRLRGMVLFGSRARGDHRLDSDADVAVFIDNAQDTVAEQMDLATDAYEIFLDADILIQPWVFDGDPRSATAPHAPRLLANIQREGIAL